VSSTATPPSPPGSPETDPYLVVERSDRFRHLRTRYRAFIFPMGALFMAWYLVFIYAAGWQREWMATPIAGSITIGYVFALLQFLTTFLIAFAYTRQERRRLLHRGRSFTGGQNGTAIAGDYLSAASFLGIAGAIALTGYDGFLYSIGFLVAWLVALLLVAELLRNTGKFTMADVLAFRMRQRPVRTAAAISTLAVSFFYLLAQMAGAGGWSPAAGHHRDGGAEHHHRRRRHPHDRLRARRRHEGHHLGPDHQGRPAHRGRRSLMSLWVLSKFGFSLSSLMGSAAQQPARRQAARAGRQVRREHLTKVDFISLAMALVLGTAGLPHVLMRFYTVPTAKEARKSVVWAIWLIGLFYLFSLVPGLRRGCLVGPEAINARPARRTRRPRCWPTSSAAPCCWASSPRWPSPRSSRWSPA
jgi:cation/acetate symporter